jgi:hypothetical protein
MATIIFYEKPRCATNARQRKVLESAGHHLIVRDLLTERWTAERLTDFLADLPVGRWFNPAAPLIKSGAIDPNRLSSEQALALLLADPLLIKRPLIEIGDVRIAGFDTQRLQASILLEQPADAKELQLCSRVNARSP